MSRPWLPPPAEFLTRAAARVVGRRAELETIVAALAAGRHLLLEGPPGTGKSTLLRAVAEERHVPFTLVEGTSELTPARLVGTHDPAAVLHHGYRDDDFVPGPLIQAMRSGALLYVEELNRAPEDTLNVLLGPLADGVVAVPRLGPVQARPGFTLVAAMNPFDRVGTARLSQSVRDRLLRLSIGYQCETEERAVVTRRAPSAPGWLVKAAVSMVRATRDHPDLAMGASVRGAIDLTLVAGELAGLRGVKLRAGHHDSLAIVLDAALCALSGRIVPAESTPRPAEAIIAEVWEDLFYFSAPVPGTSPADDRLERLAAEITSAVHVRRDRPPTRPGRRATAPLPVPDRSRFRPAPATREAQVFTARSRPGGGLSTGDPSGGAGPMVGGGAEDGELAAAIAELLTAHGGIGALDAAAADLDTTRLRELTRQLALRIIVKVARPSRPAPPGRGTIQSVRYRFNSDDLDLDRTLEEVAGKPHPEYDDFWVRERVRPRRVVALLLDASGSMRGPGLLHAAVATAALAQALTDDDFAVVMFWRDAAVLKAAGQERSLPALVEDLLSVRARGLTNVRLGLEVGLRELARSPAADKVGILFTDALHNLGDDPEPLARRFSRLHVIGTSLVPDRVEACRRLAALGGGECTFIESVADIAAAVGRCLAG